MADEMVIFTRTFDLLAWLLPVTNTFPRAHRHTLTQRLLDAAFDLREALELANHRQGQARLAKLREADEALDRVRLLPVKPERQFLLLDAEVLRGQSHTTPPSAARRRVLQ